MKIIKISTELIKAGINHVIKGNRILVQKGTKIISNGGASLKLNLTDKISKVIDLNKFKGFPDMTVIDALKNSKVSKVKDKWGDTPLHHLAFYGSPEIHKLVLKHPDATNVKNNNGKTPANLFYEKNYIIGGWMGDYTP